MRDAPPPPQVVPPEGEIQREHSDVITVRIRKDLLEGKLNMFTWNPRPASKKTAKKYVAFTRNGTYQEWAEQLIILALNFPKALEPIAHEIRDRQIKAEANKTLKTAQRKLKVAQKRVASSRKAVDKCSADGSG